MAVFQNAFNFMIINEDATQAHAIVPDSPPGSFAISGINSASFPTQYTAIAALPQSQRGPAVENFYQATFWNKWLQSLIFNDLAMRVFDTSVNMGISPAVKILQIAINTLTTPSIIVDGQWGPNTVAMANKLGDGLVSAFKFARVAHYEAIVATNPADQKYLKNWLARAGK